MPPNPLRSSPILITLANKSFITNAIACYCGRKLV